MMHRKQTCAAVWALLALMLPLLSGCAQMVQERPLEDLSNYVVEPGTQAPAEDGYVERTQYVTLYFISAQGDRLVPVTREVTMHDGMSRAQAALEALTGGPLEGETDAVWPDAGGAVGVRSLELSGGVATVSLPSRYRVLTPETLYAVRLAVAARCASCRRFHMSMCLSEAGRKGWISARRCQWARSPAWRTWMCRRGMRAWMTSGRATRALPA